MVKHGLCDFVDFTNSTTGDIPMIRWIVIGLIIIIYKTCEKHPKNKVVTKPQAQTNCDVTSFRSDIGTDGPTNQPTNQPTNIVSYRGAT